GIRWLGIQHHRILSQPDLIDNCVTKITQTVETTQESEEWREENLKGINLKTTGDLGNVVVDPILGKHNDLMVCFTIWSVPE
ncbi:hypothetical protein ACQP3C_28930, partial [Escherichia coli]